ncbi:ABC transporter substrate-binding protein [Streptomyces abyssalis]|uniref:ABC transporter substrate-binding protein n=1 Tax=Streptomyces abyssalis TaxID=933944 RepID=A0A1E7JI47_9ACTN|nr:N-acetylglucosamine/diacetylchitobiose ABC transporter substrate-binding protein [Streptomyces abyssalis]OEU86143.1 ABC transporter substrate-binding protein [Streptomyces abyssalis]OEU92391.1 ABC transporter substrate-binding protein [Streptomyces abyssalis]OEV28102.1 ABC transporter substrate-binding protein [Streptomyces nanshensis]
MGSNHVNRRDLIKRSAAVGLVAAPGMGMLSACASGGGENDDKVEKGKKTKDNPLAVNKDAKLEVVIFNGGYGDQYALDNHKVYEKNFGNVSHSKTQKIRTKMQPRMVKGNPPDVINNSGAENMDVASLIEKDQVADLQPLLDAPSLYDPSKKVSETLLPGVVEKGRFGSDKVYQLNYSYTVYGVWYSKTNLEKLDLEYPKTWDEMLAACAKAKKEGIAGWTYAGKHPYYFAFSLYPFIAKIGGKEVLEAIDNLEPNAWKHDAVKKAFEAYHELYAKGYILKGTPGIDHIQSQTQWTKGKALFLPNGSWVENEAKGTTPKDFEMTVAPPSSLDKSDAMPFETIWAEASEPFMVPAQAKNVEGGMEWLRTMMSKQSTQNFSKQVSALTCVDGASDGLDLQSGLASAQEILKAAGDENRVGPRIRDWYLELDKDKVGGALASMMSGDIEPAEAMKRCQKAADEVAKDDSVKKYKR